MSPALLVFAKRGWFVAQSFGDRCPECVGLGLLSGAEPSVLMERARLASANCAALAEQSKHLAAHPMNGDDGRDE